jgi:hypothetical protein
MMNEKQAEAYLNALDESLSEVLGKTAAKIMYSYLEEVCKIKKEEIPSKIDEFESQLHKILGSAAEIIEDKIDQKLRSTSEEESSCT